MRQANAPLCSHSPFLFQTLFSRIVGLQCNHEETLAHLFWSCLFAQQCWDFVCPQVTNQHSVLEAFYVIKDSLNLPFAVEIIILAAWSIWIIRNRKIFEDQNPSFSAWKIIFKQELQLLSYRMKKKWNVSFKAWLQSLVLVSFVLALVFSFSFFLFFFLSFFLL
jgi:hypothetical protein